MVTKLDLDNAIVVIKRFLTGKLLQSGLDGYVIGLSGGIDSALSATLAVEAVGKEKVFGIMMPYKTSSENSQTDALELINKLGIDHKIVDISPMIDAYFNKITDDIRLRAGNKMARERMSILFDHAFSMKRMVLGTGNRTEIALGYTTWYGDAACSLNPIGELYKTEVRQMAKMLGVPESIINKPPSADLWVGQTDEDEIGVSYNKIDNLLKLLIDDGTTKLGELKESGFETTDVSRVVSLLNLNVFKRKLPDIAPLDRIEIPNNIQISE